jgi:magnesium-transporting ATPase (P-type)
MVEVGNLAAQEAALTGESVPIDKTVDKIAIEGDPSATLSVIATCAFLLL